MTLQQIGDYAEAQEEAMRRQAILLDGQARQLISGINAMLDNKQKYLTLDKLYPELFKKRYRTLKDRRAAERKTWLSFLFG